MTPIFVYITNPNKAEARKIATHLLKEKLIACAVVTSKVNSMYWWEGKIADENEFVLIAKTTNNNFQKIVSEVEKIHSYTIPCIAKIPVVANKKYERWLRSCLYKGKSKS